MGSWYTCHHAATVTTQQTLIAAPEPHTRVKTRVNAVKQASLRAALDNAPLAPSKAFSYVTPSLRFVFLADTLPVDQLADLKDAFAVRNSWRWRYVF